MGHVGGEERAGIAVEATTIWFWISRPDLRDDVRTCRRDKC